MSLLLFVNLPLDDKEEDQSNDCDNNNDNHAQDESILFGTDLHSPDEASPSSQITAYIRVLRNESWKKAKERERND
jgi:hypothetical protein